MITLWTLVKIFIFLEMTSRAATTLPLHISRNVQSFRYRLYIGIFTGCGDETVDVTDVSRKTFDIWKTKEPKELLWVEDDELYF